MSHLKDEMLNKLDELLEKRRFAHVSKLETFDMYKEKVKLKAGKSYDDYKQKLQHGYEIIIQMIQSKLPKEEG